MSSELHSDQKSVVELMDEYVALVRNGRTRSEAKEFLLLNKVDENRLKEAIRSVHDLNLLVDVEESERRLVMRSFYFGIAMLVIGVAISLWATFASGGILYAVAVAPMVSGATIIAYYGRRFRRFK